jgi:uncharacterized protein YdeI (YjbR/CyaY-like superfamily)
MKKIKKKGQAKSVSMEIRSFQSSVDFRKWLLKNHDKSSGIWLRIAKVDAGIMTVTYAEALDEALCFGWIDGQKKSGDSRFWLQRFTPRKPNSQWSKKNTEHAERLMKAKKMAPSGLREIGAAKSDGRWKAAYDSFGTAVVPQDFLKELAKNKKAKAFFETLNKTNLYSISYRLQTAKKAETRANRIKAIIKMLESGKKFH